MLYYQQPTDYILQCHDISHFLPVFETDMLPESYQSLHHNTPPIPYTIEQRSFQFECTQSTLRQIKREQPKTSQCPPYAWFVRTQDSPRVVPVKVEPERREFKMITLCCLSSQHFKSRRSHGR
mmetsp:Transcript_7060/g.7748  ORF Transcript_7060/g.7748 Transcript_7060/m.7748 type:complete len:123 (-) Transcript_7060:532-900(-)